MHKTASGFEDDAADNGMFEGFTPLTPEEAQKVKLTSASVSPWLVLGWQFLAGVLVACAAWAWTEQPSAGWSAFYGALAVVVPAASFARGLSRQKQASSAERLLIGFAVWEAIKIGLTVAMLLAAPRVIVQLNWLALLAGFVVTIKAYWVAMWLHLVRKTR